MKVNTYIVPPAKPVKEVCVLLSAEEAELLLKLSDYPGTVADAVNRLNPYMDGNAAVKFLMQLNKALGESMTEVV